MHRAERRLTAGEKYQNRTKKHPSNSMLHTFAGSVFFISHATLKIIFEGIFFCIRTVWISLPRIFYGVTLSKIQCCIRSVQVQRCCSVEFGRPRVGNL
jgi:hypothetical protein